jgi:hypothetical protein
MKRLWERDVLNTDSFIVTGILTNGKRFEAMHIKNVYHAFGINLWKGSVWLLRDGKRILVKKVCW